MDNERWTGRHIMNAEHGRGLVLTDRADKTTPWQGQLLVQFDRMRLRCWVDARNCELAGATQNG